MIGLPAKSIPGWLHTAALAAVIFSWVFFAGTRNNHFPYFYHTDEPSKVEQLLSGERNFYHPALMLNATTTVAKFFRVPAERQRMVITGRCVSAYFAALAVAGFALVARQLGGLRAGWLAGIFCALSADFFDAAHYMKEDPYWISGLAFTFLAGLLYWRSPDVRAAVFLGMAAGWSVAGKYIGFIALLVALLTIFGKMIASRSWRFLSLAVVAISAAVVFLTINYQILSEPRAMTAGLGKEVGALYNEHHQNNEKFKPSRYLDLLRDTVPAAAIVLAAGLLASSFRGWQKRPLPEWLFLLLPILIGVALTLTPKGSARYFLPIGLMLLTSAGIALGRILRVVETKPAPFRYAAWALIAVVLVSILVPLSQEYSIRRFAFAIDYREKLANYMRETIPAGTLIAADLRAAMPLADDPRYAGFSRLLPYPALISRYTADLGTYDELMARGVAYVIVSGRDSNRLSNEDNFSGSDAQKLPVRRAFYQELARRAKVEWQTKLGDNKYLNVSLILYRLQP